MSLVERCALVLIALTVALPAAAQQRAARAIGKPLAEFDEPFTGPLHLVELRDGRLLVHDGGEKRLVIADFATGDVSDAARLGAGPLEFQTATALLRGPGDSIRLHDLVQSRVLLLSPEGKPLRTEPFAKANDMMAMLKRPLVRETDRVGTTYAELREMAIEGGKMTMSDSVVLIRTRSNGKADTLAKMPSYLTAPEMTGSSIKLRFPGFPPMDAWGVFPDGRVLIVRGTTYTPEIHLADGTKRTAPAIAFSIPPLSSSMSFLRSSAVTRTTGNAMAGAVRLVPSARWISGVYVVPRTISTRPSGNTPQASIGGKPGNRSLIELPVISGA
ncbi:MAG TPA: hypothetical protein VM764_01135, partial [Gemmatimonadaceae bacterium]|nr:hypothetical protein [Gemmatimonadaceae bacterium]